jgi:hypothetical protein
MTQDEIIEVARQVGMRYREIEDEFYSGYADGVYLDELEAFAKLIADKAFQNGYEKGVAAFNDAVLLEREACAKVCEQSAQNYYPVIPEASGACTHLAAAIRARGQA